MVLATAKLSGEDDLFTISDDVLIAAEERIAALCARTPDCCPNPLHIETVDEHDQPVRHAVHARGALNSCVTIGGDGGALQTGRYVHVARTGHP